MNGPGDGLGIAVEGDVIWEASEWIHEADSQGELKT
jgi:hypothetical protein